MQIEIQVRVAGKFVSLHGLDVPDRLPCFLGIEPRRPFWYAATINAISCSAVMMPEYLRPGTFSSATLLCRRNPLKAHPLLGDLRCRENPKLVEIPERVPKRVATEHGRFGIRQLLHLAFGSTYFPFASDQIVRTGRSDTNWCRTSRDRAAGRLQRRFSEQIVPCLVWCARQASKSHRKVSSRSPDSTALRDADQRRYPFAPAPVRRRAS